jgi:hypothetical protein
MSRRKRRALALGILFVTFACLQCAEKEGSVSPYIETEPPQYRIQYLDVVPVRVDPGGTADVEVRVVDFDGDPVAGHELVFEVAYGAIESPSTTDENGIVRVTYTAPYGTVQEMITASGTSLVPKEVFLQVGEGALEADPMSILADGISYSMLSIDLVDQSGVPVEGALITWEVDSAKGMISDAVSRTDSTGQASAVLVAMPSMTDAVATVTAQITYGDVEPYSEVVDVDMRGVTVLVEAYPSELPADGVSYTVVAAWVGETTSGVPLTNVPVTFTTSLGAMGVTAYTDQSGVAAAYLYSPTSPGVADVMATYGLMTGSTQVSFGSLSLSVETASARMAADAVSSQYVTATVLGEGNTPVSGVTVDFATSAGVITGSSVTDFNGNADALLTSPDYPATATVVASFGESLAETVLVTFVGLDLALQARDTRMVADGISSQTVTASLQTVDGNPVGGVPIDFSTGAGIITRSAITDAYGKAEAELTGPDFATSATVAATYRSYQDAIPVSFEVPVLTLTATPMAINADPSEFSLITAYVSFSDDFPVPDNTVVTFSTTEGAITPSTVTSSGIADVELWPSGVANTAVEVSAYSAGASATTQVMFTPDAPENIHSYAVPGSIIGDGSASATVIAEVTDAFGNHVDDGTLVTFSVAGGNGIVTPSSVTASGIATAKFVPTGGSGTATIQAYCETNHHSTTVTLLSDSPGAIVADPDTAWIAVADTWDASSATVFAYVYDSSTNPVEDGTEVSFTIDHGPGGGEYLDDDGNGYGPVVKPTAGGMASVTVNSGTKSGTLIMTIESGDYAATAVKVGIAAGPPDSIFINTGDIVRGSMGGEYILCVSGLVRDKYSNPVGNGTAVYWTLDRPDIGVINPETVTGNVFPCVNCIGEPNKGVTHACLTFPTSTMTKAYTLLASCGDIESSFATRMPIVLPVEFIVEAYPASVSGPDGGDVTVTAYLEDDVNTLPITGAAVRFSVAGAGSLWSDTEVTDTFGLAWTVMTIPAGTPDGTTTITGKLYLSDIEDEVEITINP